MLPHFKNLYVFQLINAPGRGNGEHTKILDKTDIKFSSYLGMHQSLISSTAHVCKVPNLLLYTKLTTNGAGFATIKLINVKRTINPRQKLF